MRRVEIVAGHLDREEIDRDQVRALMEQLEHRMLGIGANAAPGDRRAGPGKRRAIGVDTLAVRFHFQLLEIVGQQGEAFVIGEDRARLAAERLRVIEVGKGGAHDDVFPDGRIAEMFVDGLRAFEEFGKGDRAERERDREADRRPQRIAPAHGFRERQDARFIDAPFDRLFRRRRQRDDPAIGIGHTALAQPFERAGRIDHGFGGGERLGGERDQRGGRIALLHRRFERATIDVGDDMDSDFGVLAGEGVDGQRRAERGPADADVDQALHLAQQAIVDRIDQQRHACVERIGFLDAGFRAHAALGGVFGGAAFGVVDFRAREQFRALAGKVRGLRQIGQHGFDGRGKMGLGPVEANRAAGQVERGGIGIEPGRIGKERGKGGLVQRLERAPQRGLVLCCHCHPVLYWELHVFPLMPA